MKAALSLFIGIWNMSMPFMYTQSNGLIDQVGDGLNFTVGLIGLGVFFLFRNQIRYSISFSNRKEKELVESIVREVLKRLEEKKKEDPS